MVRVHVLSEFKIWRMYTWGAVDLYRVLLKYTHDISLGFNQLPPFMTFILLIWMWAV